MREVKVIEYIGSEYRTPKDVNARHVLSMISITEGSATQLKVEIRLFNERTAPEAISVDESSSVVAMSGGRDDASATTDPLPTVDSSPLAAAMSGGQDELSTEQEEPDDGMDVDEDNEPQMVPSIDDRCFYAIPPTIAREFKYVEPGTSRFDEFHEA